MKTIAFINQKGGVGKTTCAVEVASRLAKSGNKVLAIDADPQANMTYIYGFNPDSVDITLKHVLDGGKLEKAILSTKENVDLLPNNIALASADRDYYGVNAFRLLKTALKQVCTIYDFCIIDSPPNLGILNLNTLIASDYIIVPVNANALSIQGLKALSETIAEVKMEENKALSVLGILLTRYNSRTKIAKEALLALEDKATKLLDTAVFNAKIRQSVAVEDAQASRHSITRSNAPIAKDYDALVKEILEKLK